MIQVENETTGNDHSYKMGGVGSLYERIRTVAENARQTYTGNHNRLIQKR
jgi:hypothetical protein